MKSLAIKGKSRESTLNKSGAPSRQLTFNKYGEHSMKFTTGTLAPGEYLISVNLNNFNYAYFLFGVD